MKRVLIFIGLKIAELIGIVLLFLIMALIKIYIPWLHITIAIIVSLVFLSGLIYINWEWAGKIRDKYLK